MSTWNLSDVGEFYKRAAIENRRAGNIDFALEMFRLYKAIRQFLAK